VTHPPLVPEARPDGIGSPARSVAFAHASEAEMARILDFYAVRWEYEPHTFPILWNLDGAVVESFSPDFYLPDLDLYLEMTTLRQRLVRKKNRKLRRLRELYPDIRIKLFYARDFRALMLKYGKVGLISSLSGTSGQVVPVRGPATDPQVEVGLVGAAMPIDLTGEPTAGEPAAAPPSAARTRRGRGRTAGSTGRETAADTEAREAR
jgi:hypothetical protein